MTTGLSWEVRDRTLRLAPRVIPQPIPAQLTLVEIRYSGVCGSDRAKLNAGWGGGLPEPWRPGHEIVGVDTRSGQLAAVDPMAPCDACARCAEGEIHLCAHLRRLGWDLPGGLGEMMLAPAKNLVSTHQLRDPAHGVLADPMAVALHGMRCQLGQPPGRLGVIGGGALAVCTAAYASAAGWEVHLVARDSRRASALRQVLDATITHRPADLPPCDAIVDAASGGDDVPIRQALAAVRDGGTVLVQNAYAPEVTLTTPLREVFRRSITVRGSFSYCRANGHDDFRDALPIIAAGSRWPTLLTSARYALTELPQGLADLDSASDARPFRVVLAIDPRIEGRR